ncbi:MAG TPA: ABC transporter permease, partial [Blastocatellia bacterium]|nr:ABC transporter permease [Blastocatellia bacterium]
MNFREVLRMAFGALWVNKLRSFLTLVGIIFGIAAVIVVVSLIEGFNVYIDEKIADIGTNALSVQRYGIDDFSSLDRFLEATRKNPDVRLEDAQAIKELAPLVDEVSPRARVAAEIRGGNQTLTGVLLQGAPANAIDIDRMTVEHGRFLLNHEDEHSVEVAFIGHDIADKCFPTGDPLGKSIKIDGRPFTVIGVAKAQGSVFGQSRDGFVIIPITTFLDIYGSRRSLNVLVSSIDKKSYAAAVDQVRVAMRVHRHIGPDQPDNFGIITPDAINNLRDKIFGTIQITTIGVTAISLVVGGIVVMNIMLVSVTERTREIGIRKALGARRFDILTQFLAESTILALVGGILGTLFALAIALLVRLTTPIPTALPILWTATSITVSAAVGLISGVYPAWRAAGLEP